MCSLQCAPRLLGGGRCGVLPREELHRVRLIVLCGGRTGVQFRAMRFGGLGERRSWVGRAQPLRRRVSICAQGASNGGDGETENKAVVADSSRKFSNLSEYGKAGHSGEERRDGVGSISGQVEVVMNGASQGQEQQQPPGEARMPAPWDVGALLAMVWDRLMRNSLVAFITSWPAWQKRRKLERLLVEADAHPQDAEKQAALLAELFKQRLASFEYCLPLSAT
jgi:hypothetical protein